MRSISVRSSFISGAGIGGAVIWGVVEFLALQWSRINERFQALGLFRAF
ncbi:MAG: hypothetical protein Q8K67_00155 [Geothrix sp.]|nr:hypothetical protein [Geothrix sp.]